LSNPVLFFGTVTAQLVHIGAMYTPGLREVLRLEPVSVEEWLAYLALAWSSSGDGGAQMRRRAKLRAPMR
jgi:hypothetical protein